MRYYRKNKFYKGIKQEELKPINGADLKLTKDADLKAKKEVDSISTPST